MEIQGRKITKTILRKKNKAGEHTFPNLRTSNKTIAILKSVVLA